MWWGDEEVTARIYGRVSLKISCLPTVKPQFRLSTKPETWGPKPDQTPPLRPAKADTFGVTSEEAAMGTD